ncbi:thioredoxin domain-containing protein [Mesonia aquimarina]|uniref:thioredoxin domain-containing protein n=1 Tax=Mesonia aquimarina TaxID=1504967 RepID=UPI000EF5D229|nr:thioredoxin domain-containing protein [Mesonia aquimarina]
MKNLQNNLAEESSPYLLQHAKNPVHWQAWDKKFFNQKKLLLISIGYSACHWCHVMENECFEDQEVAKIMNENFINIKIDREERPDLDHIYMQALQAMTGHGGWPLNVVCLPDGRPVWGATYLPKKQWTGTLHQLSDLYKKSPDKMVEYAEKLEKGLQQINLIEPIEEKQPVKIDFINKLLPSWKSKFDYTYGGMKGAPKFLMPNNYQFLLRYAVQTNKPELIDFVSFSLNKIIYGGIYDAIGGGFSRYAVDEKWHIPHFEKMLYDNAQMLSLLAEAYAVSKKPLFKKTLEETFSFIDREFSAPNGGFYAALDADSLTENNQHKEGAFYTWTKNELQQILGTDFLLFAEYYNVNEKGYWEENQYVLRRISSVKKIAEKFKLSEKTIAEKVEKAKEQLFQIREKRAKPALDTKILTAWNALMLSAYCDAYSIFQNEDYLEKAKQNMSFLLNNRVQKNGALIRSFKQNNIEIKACLDDYAFFIEALIKLYEITFEEQHLLKAKQITDYCLDNFLNEEANAFYYTSHKTSELFIKTIEIEDNVIPSSNSAMAKNLFKLSKFFRNPNYKKIALNLYQHVEPRIANYPSGYSNWLQVQLDFSTPFYELIFRGDNAKENIEKVSKYYLPNIIKAYKKTAENTTIPILQEKQEVSKNEMHLCEDARCFLPSKNYKQIISHILNQSS